MRKDDIPSSLVNDTYAKCDGIRYKILKFELWYDKQLKKLRYSAVMLDKNGRDIVHAPIEFVEILKEG